LAAKGNTLKTTAAVAVDDPAYFTIDQEEPVRRYYVQSMDPRSFSRTTSMPKRSGA
jgi:hypothetical protein